MYGDIDHKRRPQNEWPSAHPCTCGWNNKQANLPALLCLTLALVCVDVCLAGMFQYFSIVLLLIWKQRMRRASDAPSVRLCVWSCQGAYPTGQHVQSDMPISFVIAEENELVPSPIGDGSERSFLGGAFVDVTLCCTSYLHVSTSTSGQPNYSIVC